MRLAKRAVHKNSRIHFCSEIESKSGRKAATAERLHLRESDVEIINVVWRIDTQVRNLESRLRTGRPGIAVSQNTAARSQRRSAGDRIVLIRRCRIRTPARLIENVGLCRYHVGAKAYRVSCVGYRLDLRRIKAEQISRGAN